MAKTYRNRRTRTSIPEIGNHLFNLEWRHAWAHALSAKNPLLFISKYLESSQARLDIRASFVSVGFSISEYGPHLISPGQLTAGPFE